MSKAQEDYNRARQLEVRRDTLYEMSQEYFNAYTAACNASDESKREEMSEMFLATLRLYEAACWELQSALIA